MKPEQTEFGVIAEPIAGPLAVQEPQKLTTPMDLLALALSKDAAIDVIERLAALQEKAQAKAAEQSFFRDLHAAQQEVPKIEPNKEVKTNAGKLMYKYASYEQLDKALRPIYLKYGMGISFSGAEAPAGKVRVLCCVSHRDGHAERYQLDLAISQGAAQLTNTDAELAAQSKAKRRILRNIFNIVDDMEDEGVGTVSQDWLTEQLAEIKRCETVAGVKAAFQAAAAVALDEVKDISAYRALKEAAKARGKELE
jgi:hypothetical protein